MHVLKAKGLGFQYHHDREVRPVINHLDLAVGEGEFLALLGPSGCGKTTLLRLLSGFLNPGEGEILYRDNPLTDPFPEGQMIFQDPGQLMPWLTVEKNISFVRPDEKGSEEEIEALLSQTGLREHRGDFPHQLSGGLKQRTALARALYARPRLLFMDEPFGSLDAPARAELQQLLLRIWREQSLTILFVTHNISEALLLADRILIYSAREGCFRPEENSLPRPRDKNGAEFLREKMRLYSLIDTL